MRHGRRWAVVLAGGDGQRMQAYISRWLGHPRPKQYCAFTGGRTMLEHTWDRAAAAVGGERVVTVVTADHRRYMESPRRLDAPGRLLAQPRRCDTGPGVFLPLTAVAAADPDAVVAVMPSDHFIFPRSAFEAVLDEAFALAAAHPDHLVLLAARPDGPETDYGWIEPGARVDGSRATRVGSFKEKPDSAGARRLHGAGALWNTMIIVAKAAALWRLGAKLRPDVVSPLERLSPMLGTRHEAAALEAVYRMMPKANFSRDILEPAAPLTLSLPLDGVHWSDWGRPERVHETLAAIGAPDATARMPRLATA